MQNDVATIARPLLQPTDAEILGVVASYGSAGVMTYVVRNILASKPSAWRNEPQRPAYRNLRTPFVYRRLIALEKAGKVRRIRSCYATQLCWALPSHLLTEVSNHER